MDENLLEIEVGVGLDDSELVSYGYINNNDKLKIQIQAWNATVVEICFDNPILFIDRGCGEITMLCENKSDSGLLKQTLEKNYEHGSIPLNHPYKLYQMLDTDKNPVLEIVCKSVEIQKTH